MEKTKILNRSGIDIRVTYEHEEAEPQTFEQPGRGENVEILRIQLMTPDDDISNLMDDCIVESVMEQLLSLEKEEKLERAR